MPGDDDWYQLHTIHRVTCENSFQHVTAGYIQVQPLTEHSIVYYREAHILRNIQKSFLKLAKSQTVVSNSDPRCGNKHVTKHAHIPSSLNAQ